MFVAEKYEKFNMTAESAENAVSVIGAVVDFSIFQFLCERDWFFLISLIFYKKVNNNKRNVIRTEDLLWKRKKYI